MKKNKTNINPALNITNFTKFSKIVLSELNEARTNPSQYVKKLTKALSNINGNIMSINGYGIYLTEGRSAVEEAISFLKTQQPMKELCYSDAISKSADELLSVIILHDGIDMKELEKIKYDLEKRMNHYGAAFGELDELIDYGTFDPEYVVINFIVCDGDKDKRERSIIFNHNIKYVGASSGLLPSEKICTVINFSEYFFHPGEIIDHNLIDKLKLRAKTDNNINSKSVQEKKRTSGLLYKEKKETYKEIITQPSNEKSIEKTIYIEDYSYKKENHEENFDEDMNLPENVERVKYIEKKTVDQITGMPKVLVKRIIIYEDGTTETSIYVKKGN